MLPLSQRTAIQVANVHDFYELNEANQEFIYNGRTYTTVIGGQTHERCMTAIEIRNDTTWTKFFGSIGKERRERQINQLLVHPKERQILVDVDKSLLYRKDIGAYPENDGYPPGVNPADKEKFYATRLLRTVKINKNVSEIRSFEVLVNKKVLNFLIQQKASGADLCIASSGGWLDERPLKISGAQTIKEFLSTVDPRLTISKFDNGESLKKSFSAKGKWYFGGLFAKAREYGNTNSKEVGGQRVNYKTIIIEDQVHQRLGFQRAINPVEFGSGASWRDYFCIKAARLADFFIGERSFEKLYFAAAKRQT